MGPLRLYANESGTAVNDTLIQNKEILSEGAHAILRSFSIGGILRSFSIEGLLQPMKTNVNPKIAKERIVRYQRCIK